MPMLTSIHYCTCTSQLEYPLFHVSNNVFYAMAHVDDKHLEWFSSFSRYGFLDNCFFYSVVYVFRKPTFCYLLFMRLF